MADNRLSGTKAAFLCDCMGPYHYARLNAVTRYMDITAIEFSSLDHTNLWEQFDNKGRCATISLFKDKPITMQPRRALIKRVRSVLNELRPQVVVISGWDAPVSLVALHWCMETKTSTVLMSESQQQDERRVWWKEAIKRRIVQLNSAGFVGGSSHKAYLNNLGMPEERIFNGCDVVDNDYFAAGAELARHNEVALRQRYSLPECYFLASSRFVKKKNISSLMRAYSAYLKSAGEDPWKLVLLGDGPLKGQISRLREKLGLSGMVLMPGFAQYPDLPVYYGLAGAFVLASTSEQWGLVVNEAMAAGLPVLISSCCGCAPDLVKEGISGFAFDPYDIEGLAHYLSFIASSKCQRYAMGKAGQKIIAEWTPEVFAQNLKNAIEFAIQMPSSRFGLVNRVMLKALMRK